MKQLLILVLLCSFCCSAYGDGGRLRFSRVAGPFLVTLFTSPEPLTPGFVDLSVMVQEGASGNILQDARIVFNLRGPSGREVNVVADRKTATNRLLQAAEVELPDPGRWVVRMQIDDANRRADLSTTVEVEKGSRRAVLIWIFALLPVFAVLLFVLNQQQKAMAKRRRGQA